MRILKPSERSRLLKRAGILAMLPTQQNERRVEKQFARLVQVQHLKAKHGKC